MNKNSLLDYMSNACFACGAHHDVISFVQTLFGLSHPIDAVRKLNDDFTLVLCHWSARNGDRVSKRDAIDCFRFT